MATKIKKRDGRIVEFNEEKIKSAIYAAAKSVGGSDIKIAEHLAKIVTFQFIGTEITTVEDVQDAVERTLIKSGYSDTAKAYILYRYQHAKARDISMEFVASMYDINHTTALESDMKRENANIDSDTAMGAMLKMGSTSNKLYSEAFLMKKEYANAHRNGDIHIHDLDFYSLTTTCCQISLTKLFQHGFSTGHGFLREPNDILTYAALACIAIQSNQNDQHGGQSIYAFDYDMAPGVAKTYLKEVLQLAVDFDLIEEDSDIYLTIKKNVKEFIANGSSILNDSGKQFLFEQFKNASMSTSSFSRIDKIAMKHTEKKTYQAMEALVHNLNTMHSRAGAQVPFSSLNYGTDTSLEGRMVIKNLLLATEAGLGHGETPIFPIQIFKVKEGINYFEEDPNYDLFELACRVSAKRLFPNFSFVDAPFNIPYYQPGRPETEIAYMGCRTRVIGNTYDNSQEVVSGRGNLSFTSINLPRLAIICNKDIDLFFKLLDDMITLVINQLLDRFKIQSEKKVYNFPFLMGNGVWLDSDKLNKTDKIGEVLKHGTLSVGFIGLAETLVALIGVHHGESKEAQDLGIKIISYMRDRLDSESQKRKLNFSLLATPAEGLSGRFTMIDRGKYGIIPGVTDRDFYTNSFHIPVYYNISAFKKLQIEGPYHALTNAGHISYIELDGDTTQNVDVYKSIVRCMHDNGIGYGAINHPVDRDPKCGYTGFIDAQCPCCGRTETPNEPFERIRRITGYLVGTTDRWNNAKKSEEQARVKHGI